MNIIETLSNIVINLISHFGYISEFILMVLESMGIPIPSEVIMPFSGLLVSRGELTFWTVVVVGALANLIGSLIAYGIGYWGGAPLVEKYGKYIMLKKHDLDLAHRWFDKYGKATAFFSRMLPIVRTYISFPAGFAKMPVGQFSVYTFLGSLPWCYLLTLTGIKMGDEWESIKKYFHILDILVVIVIIYFAIRLVIKKKQYGNNE